MRLFFSLLSLFIFSRSFPIELADSTKSKLEISVNVSINSNGMAPIPSFSLGKPALIGALALQKKRFSYDPQIAYGLDMRPWIIDNWLHYRIVYRPGFELRTGADFSMFFSRYDAMDYKILQGQQYLTFEIAGIIRFSPVSSLSLMYWSDNGQDHGSIRGNFYNIVYDQAELAMGQNMMLAGSLQLFCLEYTGKNDGLFASPRLAISVRNIPLSLFAQATQAIVSNMEPWPGFRWNAGLAYVFRRID